MVTDFWNKPFSEFELEEIKDEHSEIKIEDTERVSVSEKSLEGKNDADQDNTSIQRPSSDIEGTLWKEHVLKTTAMISVESDTPKKETPCDGIIISWLRISKYCNKYHKNVYIGM